MQQTKNEFYRDLEYSLDPARNETYDKFYYEQFPQLELVKSVEDLTEQSKGIDKILCFPNGNKVKVEEKTRTKDFNDILLELYSNYSEKKLGWLFTCQSEYLMYYIEPSKKAYILPMQLLRMVWKNNHIEWQKKYKTTQAKNKNYASLNIAIPEKVLMEALISEMCKTYKTNI
jgi:hypothetical protein